MKYLKNILVVGLIAYLGIGTIFYLSDLRVQRQGFSCPTPETCTQIRSSFDSQELGTAVAMITLWPVLILGHMFHS